MKLDQLKPGMIVYAEPEIYEIESVEELLSCETARVVIKRDEHLYVVWVDDTLWGDQKHASFIPVRASSLSDVSENHTLTRIHPTQVEAHLAATQRMAQTAKKETNLASDFAVALQQPVNGRASEPQKEPT